MLPIICVIGPTASGKTKYAIRLAQMLDGEIISGDSMQIYKGMDIGTAKPTPEETEGVPHHLIDVCDIHQPYSVSEFVHQASEAILDISSRGKTPIVAGGTGLYIDTLINGISLSETPSDPGLRKELFDFAEKNGALELHRRLEKIDPASALAIHPNNVKRVVRAIEIFKTTGKTKSQLDEQSRGNKKYDARVVILMPRSREEMYSRIDRRVDEMFCLGLETEVRELCSQGLREAPTASQAIGYKEFYPYFDGECDLSTVRENICLNTRHYAKRQLTWFARMEKNEIIEV